MERIAKIHPTATLSPTKDEILHQQFGSVTSIGAFRFVDPNGKVGIETLLVRETTNGALLQFPVTYRNNALVIRTKSAPPNTAISAPDTLRKSSPTPLL